MEHIDETKGDTGNHPQAHKAVRKQRSALPPLAIEIGIAVTAGWTMYATTGDWKTGISVTLATLFGGLLHRGNVWYLKR